MRDLLNQLFGKLIVIDYSHYVKKNSQHYWLVKCVCGKIYPIRQSHLLYSGVTACSVCCDKRLGYTLEDQINAFWNKVQKTKDCWLWKGASTEKHGYGKMKWKNKQETSNRISWQIHNGEIPKGFYVLHKCDNPPCVNPNHLFLGTHKDNMKDMSTKHRTRPGTTVLNPEKVKEIRQLLREQKLSYLEISKLYNVTKSCISAIATNRSWSYIK